jgi:DNA-directed RNA polymerase sigma subunit (sigma70/sigma32)
MGVSRGIQRYKEAAKTKGSASKDQSKKKKDKDKEKEKEKAPVLAKKVAEDAQLQAALEEARLAEEAAREEEAIQKEIAAELEKDAEKTSSLVKEDFSPVNTPRERLIVEYAPLIKYIAQKIAARLPANIELDDLISSGVIGLMDAIEKYEQMNKNNLR